MAQMDRKTADREFDQWADAMRLDLDQEGRDENDRSDFQLFRHRMVKALMGGHGTIDKEDEKTVFILDPLTEDYNGDPIVFRKPKGSAFLVMDRKKKTADIGKMYASMGDMTGLPAATFSKLDTDDVQVCIAVWSFLLGF
jgi:hypothetical protein